MGLWILESTATLQDLDGRSAAQTLGRTIIKHNKDGIVLVPQPSDDPNDPLNWPLWQRDLITFLLCLLSVFASTLSSLMAANTVTFILWFDGLTLTQAVLLTGYHLAGVGISGFLFVASARVWGKRHLWIIAPIVIIASSIWGGCSGHSYNSLVAARFFQGVGLAPLESLLNAAVGDLYFVHESGSRLALSNMCLFGGGFFTPVIVGITTLHLGWQWTFWLIAIFVAAVYPFVYLFCAETTYTRKPPAETSSFDLVEDSHKQTTLERTESASSTSSPSSSGHEHSFKAAEKGASTQTTAVDDSLPTSVIHQPVQRKLLTRQTLAWFSGRKTDESFWLLCIRPFPLFFHPAVLWACLTQGAMIAWTALICASLAVIMLGLSFNEAQTGYMYTGAFVGALIGFIISGIICDPVARWLTKRNAGIFEPEFRLFLVIPMAITASIGLFGFGCVAASPATYGWLLPDVFFAFVCAALVFGAVVSAQYLVDAHHDITTESFTCMLIFKNLLTFALTFKALDWLIESGPRTMFFAIGYAQIAIMALALPMYVLGKRNRAFFARYDIVLSSRGTIFFACCI